ncbi:cysteine protease [Stylonychia lemnae]|uniref:Cysteine protease n=1 Tax=Stylonychia lemnae TaxID=5949 RepID=A0A078AVR9_STYLE|nr:cysteine protease [Stylonychia lemnae]|eukprot:CDW86181.1 cysteine protease [Stylonychia lemnae]
MFKKAIILTITLLVVFTATLAILLQVLSPGFSKGSQSSTFLQESQIKNDFDNLIRLRYNQYLQKYDKNYKQTFEYLNGLNTFKNNIAIIDKYNQNQKSFVLKANRFSDLSVEEFKRLYTGRPQTSQNIINSSSSEQDQTVDQDNTNNSTNKSGKLNTKIIESRDILKLPESFDWRQKNVITSVKDQGGCGGCYCFTMIAALESALLIKNKEKYQGIDLSEQQIIDCSVNYGAFGCNGGFEFQAGYLMTNTRVAFEKLYPYLGRNKECNKTLSNDSSVPPIKQTLYKTGRHSSIMKMTLMNQPYAIGISSSSEVFRFYSSGVITSYDCSQNIDHSVLLIGWGKTNYNLEYWIIKNQWGTSWGENGYVKVMINNDGLSPCQVGFDLTIPVV